jgi:L-lactate dehydrogenase complex protein LldG
MSNSRELFLSRIRRAVSVGNRAGHAPPLPERGNTGYQGAGADPAGRFYDECTAAGGRVHRVGDTEAGAACVLELARSMAACRALLGRERILADLGIAERLRGIGVETRRPGESGSDNDREGIFAADVGITGVDYLIGETGSVVLSARPDQPRALSLLPPVHIAVARCEQIVPDLFDLLQPETFSSLPSSLVLITGPSKTGDIELKLVTGVHGPGELHVVLIE